MTVQIEKNRGSTDEFERGMKKVEMDKDIMGALFLYVKHYIHLDNGTTGRVQSE